jgi:hypothetical protein
MPPGSWHSQAAAARTGERARDRGAVSAAATPRDSAADSFVDVGGTTREGREGAPVCGGGGDVEGERDAEGDMGAWLLLGASLTPHDDVARQSFNEYRAEFGHTTRLKRLFQRDENGVCVCACMLCCVPMLHQSAVASECCRSVVIVELGFGFVHVLGLGLRVSECCIRMVSQGCSCIIVASQCCLRVLYVVQGVLDSGLGSQRVFLSECCRPIGPSFYEYGPVRGCVCLSQALWHLTCRHAGEFYSASTF